MKRQVPARPPLWYTDFFLDWKESLAYLAYPFEPPGSLTLSGLLSPFQSASIAELTMNNMECFPVPNLFQIRQTNTSPNKRLGILTTFFLSSCKHVGRSPDGLFKTTHFDIYIRMWRTCIAPCMRNRYPSSTGSPKHKTQSPITLINTRRIQITQSI